MPLILSKIASLAKELYPETVSIRNYLHSNPELSYKEFETSDYIKKSLESSGIKDVHHIAETGILAHITGLGNGAKKIILRAELDALPIAESTGLEYSSRNKGVMHACGHDAHMAMLLMSAKILFELRNEFGGDIYFLFQPGEELAPGGASLVLKEGTLQDIGPDAVIAQHVLPELESGKIGFRPGKYMASSDELYIDISGKGGHAALPGESTDQIGIASSLISKLKSAVQDLGKNKPLVLGVGKLIADGATNVIPSNVHIEGTLRTFDEKLRLQVHQLIGDLCKENETEEVSVKYEIRKGYPVLINDKDLTGIATGLSEKIIGKQNTKSLDLRMSSEDFAFYSQNFPVLFYRLGVKEPGKSTRSLHTSQFDIYEPAMETGVKMMVSIAMELLNAEPLSKDNY